MLICLHLCQVLLYNIPLHHVLLSHFPQLNNFCSYHQVPHLKIPPHNWGCVIWEFFYYLIQCIPISLGLVFSNISVYYTFIFSIRYFFSLFIIYIIWALFYYLIQGILIIFCLIIGDTYVYYTFVFSLCCSFSLFIV